MLHEVNIDTASNGRGGRCGHDLTLIGLKDPHGFQRLVWAMKREQQQRQQQGTIVSSSLNESTTSNSDPQTMLTLLQDIRQELRQLREEKQGGPSNQPSAPTEEQVEDRPFRIV